MTRVALFIALPVLLAAQAARADRFAAVDFDADLRTVLVDLDAIQKQGGTAMLKELEVEGRTSALTGAYFHTEVVRRFDCTSRVESIASVTVFHGLDAAGEAMAVPMIAIVPRAGSINAREEAMACDGAQAPGPVYPSERAAVLHAYADAVKLPSDQSNHTKYGPMGPGGPGAMPGVPPKPPQ